ncbi:general transcription factor IIIA, b [Brachionichthys hirsutus]|uniref:general transcription factor IIIA, b n=1 Tax=Brachionichthys hirsutus TaxID=412623 RepID=UPI003604F692
MGERLQSQKSYICSFFDCNAEFSKSWKLEAHLCKHTGLKPFTCDTCAERFCTRYQLTRHELDHSGEKPHKCSADGCAEAFVTNGGMKDHMARAHLQEKQYKCDQEGCGECFNKKNQLKAHKNEHQQILPFQCTFSDCDQKFPTRGKLKRHERMHGGYPCEDEACPFQGKTWTEYLKHRNKHTVKVPCGGCKKLFNNTWFLRQHELRAHSGERRTLTCPREGCDKEFAHGFNLESHVLGDHDGKKPFICMSEGCGKSFAMKESLWRHSAAHDPEKKKLTKLHPKKNRPWHVAQRARRAAAAKAEATALAAKLRDTNLKDDEC